MSILSAIKIGLMMMIVMMTMMMMVIVLIVIMKMTLQFILLSGNSTVVKDAINQRFIN